MEINNTWEGIGKELEIDRETINEIDRKTINEIDGETINELTLILEEKNSKTKRIKKKKIEDYCVWESI